MTRASVAGVCALCFGLSIACGGGRAEDTAADGQSAASASASGDAAGRPRPVEVTGCLTARGDQFVLTDLERSAAPGETAGTAQTATESYQLVGDTDELRKHVGQQVRVSGEADPQQVAEVRETTPAAPAGATGTAGQQSGASQGSQRPQAGEPQVRTETETRLEVAKLRVQSVTAAGGSCQAELTGGAPRRPGQ